MAICSSVQSIAASECIGDSLVTINNNFANLNTDVCTLLTLINTLSSNMDTSNLPYVRLTLNSTAAVNFAPNATTKIILNTVEGVTKGGNSYISLNTTSGNITIEPGTYRTKTRFSTLYPNGPGVYWFNQLYTQAILRKSSGTPANIITGPKAIPYSAVSPGLPGWGLVTVTQSNAYMEGSFEVATSSTFEVQLKCTDNPASSYPNDIVCVAEFWKLA